jgi:spermidine synthase
MLDLWFSEYHAPDAKLSILVKEQLYSEQTPFQKIDFFDSETFGKFFTLDGLIMITEKDEFIYHEMITNVPMAVNPDIKKVLIIGGGDGGSRDLPLYDSRAGRHGRDRRTRRAALPAVFPADGLCFGQ